MKRDEIRIGAKVVPFQKTVGGFGDLGMSACWARAKAKKQRFLYVVFMNRGYVGLSENTSGGCDYFHAEDFFPYPMNED